MAAVQPLDWNSLPAAVWRRHRQALRPVTRIDPVRLESLQGIERQKQALVANTERFIEGLPANNVLLWGARGTGKSSLIKGLLNQYFGRGLRIIQVDKDDLVFLPEIVDDIVDQPQRFVVFCDDLSFEAGDAGYKALKSILEGSIELPPENVLVYATSNRRHLMPEYMSDNESVQHRDGEVHPGEAIEEQISLSDRFGLWLSFYPFRENEYLATVDALFPSHPDREELHRQALLFAMTRGGRSGRTAQQFYRSHARRADADPT
ncbi:ATP-binding protein [Hydrocarboniclastica marina]|uniref:ATP-binding protein n=1 Tax=Hydrocarboniclastica marina TaxID=2259620 RepID=A0A4P7XEW7_9ALTE|nr:ATP-binding protein [Hydrocarboniclastica marina]QCF25185.1 ATP-binding protein [Hydrocarboniclastica marina]